MTFPVCVQTIDPELEEVIREDGTREIDYDTPGGRGWLQGHITRSLLSGLAVKLTPLEGPRPAWSELTTGAPR
ncbi:hypothetical protein [Rhodobacter maris]|uniref:Uncharacterized protein n=1 Tax=Rhodobacter maris TaxID=446682 RepID=A0A285RWT3_9RHOB|nr:hypothetical protein [Rhodobacter maris]SOB98516.1 hypothetical protein SAMN05877831_1021 [Rhodobacter maris]